MDVLLSPYCFGKLQKSCTQKHISNGAGLTAVSLQVPPTSQLLHTTYQNEISFFYDFAMEFLYFMTFELFRNTHSFNSGVEFQI